MNVNLVITQKADIPEHSNPIVVSIPQSAYISMLNQKHVTLTLRTPNQMQYLQNLQNPPKFQAINVPEHVVTGTFAMLLAISEFLPLTTKVKANGIIDAAKILMTSSNLNTK